MRAAVLSLVHNILQAMRRDQKSLFFQWDLDASRCRIRIDFYSCIATCQNPIEKIMTSSRDASRAIYCEPSFSI